MDDGWQCDTKPVKGLTAVTQFVYQCRYSKQPFAIVINGRWLFGNTKNFAAIGEGGGGQHFAIKDQTQHLGKLSAQAI